MDTLNTVLQTASFFRGGDLILKEVLKETDSNAGLLCSLKRLSRKLPWILFLIGVKYCTDNPEILGNYLKSLILSFIYRLFYRSVTFPVLNSNNTTTESKLGQHLTQNINPLLMQVKSNEKSIEVKYIPRLHQSYLDQTRESIIGEFANLNQSVSKFFLFMSNNTYQQYKASQWFPSNNYRHLEQIIRMHVRRSQLNKCYFPLGILIDGEPGLGKSGFASYLASNNIISSVFRADLNTFSVTSPAEVFRLAFGSIPIVAPSLFLIDEMDKYLDNYIHQQINSAIKGDSKISSEMIKVRCQREFLTALLGSIERISIGFPCILVFCCNNFDTIFKDLDLTHYHSLFDRFLRVPFKRYSSEEIKEFLHFYNENARSDPDLYYPHVESVLSLLKPNVEITPRKLFQLLTLRQYNFPAIIEELNCLSEEI